MDKTGLYVQANAFGKYQYTALKGYIGGWAQGWITDPLTWFGNLFKKKKNRKKLKTVKKQLWKGNGYTGTGFAFKLDSGKHYLKGTNNKVSGGTTTGSGGKPAVADGKRPVGVAGKRPMVVVKPKIGGKRPAKKGCDEGRPSGRVNCKVATVRLKQRCQPGKGGCPYWVDTKYNGVFKKAQKRGKRWVCNEGRRSGKHNCQVATIRFKVKQPAKCTRKQGKRTPTPGCTYWIDTKYNGVFKRARR
jgi:hypothetical protein